MVATHGPGWYLAACLEALIDEADKRKPSRSRASDGSIGDLAHRNRVSDHNPSNGWVCAVDIDDDGDSYPILGVDLLVKHLTDSRDRRVKYVIRNGRIWTPAEGWHAYSGASPHDHHAHISVWNTVQVRNDLRPWWPVAKPTPPPQEDDDMRKIVRGDKTNEWWITDGITARHVNDQAEAGQLAFLGLALWDDGKPFVVPQSFVDDLTKVPRGKTLA